MVFSRYTLNEVLKCICLKCLTKNACRWYFAIHMYIVKSFQILNNHIKSVILHHSQRIHAKYFFRILLYFNWFYYIDSNIKLTWIFFQLKKQYLNIYINRSYLSTIPTYNSNLNSHFYLIESGNYKWEY